MGRYRRAAETSASCRFQSSGRYTMNCPARKRSGPQRFSESVSAFYNYTVGDISPRSVEDHVIALRGAGVYIVEVHDRLAKSELT